MDLTEALHNLESAVLERKEEKAISSIEAFQQNSTDSGDIKMHHISGLFLKVLQAKMGAGYRISELAMVFTSNFSIMNSYGDNLNFINLK